MYSDPSGAWVTNAQEKNARDFPGDIDFGDGSFITSDGGGFQVLESPPAFGTGTFDQLYRQGQILEKWDDVWNSVPVGIDHHFDGSLSAGTINVVYDYTNSRGQSFQTGKFVGQIGWEDQIHDDPYAFQGITINEALPAIDGNEDMMVRPPDYYSVDISVAIPGTEGIVGWNGVANLDRYGHLYISPGGGTIGKSLLEEGSISVTANWMMQNSIPNQLQLHDFLTGNSINYTAGFFVGFNVTYSLDNGQTSVGLGLVSPQIGLSYNYQSESMIYNTNLKW